MFELLQVNLRPDICQINIFTLCKRYFRHQFVGSQIPTNFFEDQRSHRSYSCPAYFAANAGKIKVQLPTGSLSLFRVVAN